LGDRAEKGKSREKLSALRFEVNKDSATADDGYVAKSGMFGEKPNEGDSKGKNGSSDAKGGALFHGTEGEEDRQT